MKDITNNKAHDVSCSAYLCHFVLLKVRLRRFYHQNLDIEQQEDLQKTEILTILKSHILENFFIVQVNSNCEGFTE